MGLKFAGRTPSRATVRFGARTATAARARPLALQIALAAALLCLVVAFARHRIGNDVPWPGESALRVFIAGSHFEPRAQLERVPGGAGWLATVGAVGVFAGEFAQQLGPRGLPWLVVTILLASGVWLLLAELNGWRRPSVPFLLLVALQLFGAAYYFASFRSPALRLQKFPPKNPYLAFDFHTHTTRSNGLLTPQQQVDWHRARGFNGLAFTDSNRLMADAELKALRAANPDMLLLNGCEYHNNREAHLILLGLRNPLRWETMTAQEVIRAAKRQGALVIVAHPWHPAKYSPEEFLRMRVDGFEAWNGVIWSRDLALLARRRRLVATTATDTLSKSGARCFTWTLLPQGLDDTSDVLRALRLRKTAAAFALGETDDPDAYNARQARLRRPGGLMLAAGAAWRTLSRAQRINTLLGLLGLGALLCAWGAQSLPRTVVPVGPNNAVGFLRRRRLGLRLTGLLLMALAFAGSLGAALLTMGATFKSGGSGAPSALTPLHAVFAWIVLDALYLYGRSLWRRTH